MLSRSRRFVRRGSGEQPSARSAEGRLVIGLSWPRANQIAKARVAIEITARSAAFSSSRTLPGHSYSASRLNAACRDRGAGRFSRLSRNLYSRNMRRQAGRVLTTFAQRRQVPIGKTLQAIIQVLAGIRPAHLFPQIRLVAASMRTLILRDAGVADAFNFAFLQDAQRFCLHGKGISPISSRKSVPPSRGSNVPGLSRPPL